MRKSGDEADKAARKGQRAMGLFGTSIKGAKSALGELGGELFLELGDRQGRLRPGSACSR